MPIAIDTFAHSLPLRIPSHSTVPSVLPLLHARLYIHANNSTINFAEMKNAQLHFQTRGWYDQLHVSPSHPYIPTRVCPLDIP